MFYLNPDSAKLKQIKNDGDYINKIQLTNGIEWVGIWLTGIDCKTVNIAEQDQTARYCSLMFLYACCIVVCVRVVASIDDHPIRYNSAHSVPISNLVCIKMDSILNSQSRDLNIAVPLATTVSHHSFDESSSEIGRHVKSLMCKMFTNKINFHRLFDGI